MPNFAVIDCGTNTFHLLIARPAADGSFEEIYRERRFIKLAENGIECIGEAPYARALKALTDFAQAISQHQVAATRVSGTAALRTASNGPDFVAEVKAKTGLHINIIPGSEEAQLIYEGVRLAMDIGGGSVEFIIVDQSGVQWFESFPVGVAVLYKKLHQTEPISTEEIEAARLFLNSKLVPFQLALARFPVHHLVGAAGTFDVIADLLGKEQPTPNCSRVDLDGFEDLYRRILAATREERHAMPGVPDDRADMIVVALILVQLILEIAAINRLTVSNFSMKEGMLSEMLRAYEARTKK